MARSFNGYTHGLFCGFFTSIGTQRMAVPSPPGSITNSGVPCALLLVVPCVAKLSMGSPVQLLTLSPSLMPSHGLARGSNEQHCEWEGYWARCHPRGRCSAMMAVVTRGCWSHTEAVEQEPCLDPNTESTVGPAHMDEMRAGQCSVLFVS